MKSKEVEGLNYIHNGKDGSVTLQRDGERMTVKRESFQIVASSMIDPIKTEFEMFYRKSHPLYCNKCRGFVKYSLKQKQEIIYCEECEHALYEEEKQRLIETAKNARKMGISYGEYQAMKYMGVAE